MLVQQALYPLSCLQLNTLCSSLSWNGICIYLGSGDVVGRCKFSNLNHMQVWKLSYIIPNIWRCNKFPCQQTKRPVLRTSESLHLHQEQQRGKRIESDLDEPGLPLTNFPKGRHVESSLENCEFQFKGDSHLPLSKPSQLQYDWPVKLGNFYCWKLSEQYHWPLLAQCHCHHLAPWQQPKMSLQVLITIIFGINALL